MEVEVCGGVDVAIHGEDRVVISRKVAFVPELPFDLCFFVMIQKEHIIILDHDRAHILDGRVILRKENFGNYDEGTRVARHDKPPAYCCCSFKAW